jgi:hypothetical protein
LRYHTEQGAKIAMPGYFFTISTSGQAQPTNTSDCQDSDMAKREASGMFADMARDISRRLHLGADWQIEVADDAGKSIFKIRVTAESVK